MLPQGVTQQNQRSQPGQSRLLGQCRDLIAGQIQHFQLIQVLQGREILHLIEPQN